MTDWTPSTFLIRHSKRSMVFNDVVVDAPFLYRLDDDREQVDTDEEPIADDVAIDVVARIGAELRHPPVRVSDPDIPALPA